MATVGFTSPPARAFNRRPGSSSSSRLPAKHLTFRVQCSAEAAQDTATAADEETVVGGSKRSSSSLIPEDNVQKALRAPAVTNANHYERLGLRRGSSYDQFVITHQWLYHLGLNMFIRLRLLMNRSVKNGGSRNWMKRKPANSSDFSRNPLIILSSEEKRRLYDWSLARSEKPDRYMWPFEVDITQTLTEPPSPQKPEDVGPTRLLGYFMLAWFILSVALSITPNR